jgi:hypothetical protein
MVYVTSSLRSRVTEEDDGRSDGVRCGTVEVRQKYHSLAVISFSSRRDILVFCLGL